MNTSYWYDTNPEVEVDFNVAQVNERVTVFIRIESDSVAQNTFELYIQKDFEDADHEKLSEYNVDTLFESGNRLILSVSFELTDKNVIVVHCMSPKFEYYFPQHLLKGNLRYPEYYLIDDNGLPSFSKFTNQENVNFNFLSSNDSLYFFKYQENFPAADPPMAGPTPVTMTMNIDSQYVSSGIFKVEKDHFYFIQNDTLANQGITLYCGSTYFPKYRHLNDLIEPLKYVTRLSEYSGIINSTDRKKSFDKFWISTFSSKQIARSAIRNYYRKVTEANKRFTDYKPGWKTDRGILYIVYGRPNAVYRTNNSESWIYDEETNFEFRILSNLFTPTLYVLRRDPAYRDNWISKVRILRGGK